MELKNTKLYHYLKQSVLKITGFFKEMYQATKGRQLAVLWIIAIFFGVIITTKYYFLAFADKYSLGVDMSNISSNDHIFFKIEKNLLTYDEVSHGQYIMFYTDKVEPFISREASIIKKVVGKKGDFVEVKDLDVFVNGVFVAKMREEALVKLGKDKEEMQRAYTIPSNALFLIGSYERSFDSRYWDYIEIKETQKLNLATPMLF